MQARQGRGVGRQQQIGARDARVAVIGAACIVLVRRGPVLTRALVLVVLLPVHLLAVALVMRGRACNIDDVFGRSCLDGLFLPVDLLMVHVVLAGAACVAALLVWAWPIRRHGARPRTE